MIMQRGGDLIASGVGLRGVLRTAMNQLGSSFTAIQNIVDPHAPCSSRLRFCPKVD